MKNSLRAALALAVLLSACTRKTEQPVASEAPNSSPTSSPSGQQAANQKMALVRFIQAVPGQERLDLWFGDAKAFSNAAYKEVTPYMQLPAERHDFKIEPAGTAANAAAATNSEGLTAGGHYTVIAERKGKKLAIDVISDDLTPPAAGKAKMRVINTAVGLGKVDVVGPNDRAFSGVGEDSSTSYKEVQPGQGTLEIRRGDKHVDAVRVPNLALQPDKLYTIVIVGGAGQPFQALPVTDQLLPGGPGAGQ